MQETATLEAHPILLPNFNRKILIDSVDSDREAWLEARKGKIGASEIATIVGLNPFKTPLYLWHEMTGRLPYADLSDNDAVWIGNELESTVAKFFTRKTNRPTEKFNKMIGLEDFDWASATPDYAICEDSEIKLLECKVTSEYNLKVWDKECPDNYHLQAIWQQGIVGIEEATVAAFVGARSLRYHTFLFERTIFDMLFEAAQRFIEINVRGDLPPVATSDDDDLLATPVKGKKVQLDCLPLLQNYAAIDANYKAQKRLADALEEQKKDIKSQIRQKMGDAQVAECDPFKVSLASVSVSEKMHAGYEYVRMTVKDTSAPKVEK